MMLCLCSCLSQLQGILIALVHDIPLYMPPDSRSVVGFFNITANSALGPGRRLQPGRLGGMGAQKLNQRRLPILRPNTEEQGRGKRRTPRA